MAIMITFKHANHEQMAERLDAFRDALKGSPAYGDAEIALCDDEKKEFTLYIGWDNEHDIDITI